MPDSRRSRTATLRFGYVLACALAWPTLASAQQPIVAAGSVSGGAGDTVDLEVGFTPGAQPVSSLQFELRLPEQLSYQSTTAGAAAEAAGKLAAASAISGGARVLIYGGNTALGAGPIAVVSLTIAAGVTARSLAVSVTGLDAAAPDAAQVTVRGSDGEVTVTGSGTASGPECGNGTVEGPDETCDPPSSCPTNCDDGSSCTADTLLGSAADCTARCSHAEITRCAGGDGCCPPSCDNTNDSDCAPSSPQCGNGTVEGPDETCDPPSSCPTNCDDNSACTTDTLTGSAAECDARCSHADITACVDGDGCCPGSCDNTSDNDCEAPIPECGNGTVESPDESCDPPSSCPTECDDNSACTTDTLVGSAADCNARCSHDDITTCVGGDGCCPATCDHNSDGDCTAPTQACGDGTIDEPRESCDPPSSCPTECDDGFACTTDALMGSAAECNARCSVTEISTCAGGDGCCPAACDHQSDSDCAPPPTGGLVLEAPNPGMAGGKSVIRVSGATPHARVELAFGIAPRHYRLGSQHDRTRRVKRCDDLSYDIHAPFVLARQMKADAEGNVAFPVQVHRLAANFTVHLQAADVSTCTLSNVVEHVFSSGKSTGRSAWPLISDEAQARGMLELIDEDEGAGQAGQIKGGCAFSASAPAGHGRGSAATLALAGLLWAGWRRRRRTRRVRGTQQLPAR